MFQEPLSAFMNRSDFAQEVLIGDETVDVIFDNGHAAGFDIAGTAPTITLPSSSAPSAALGDAVTVGGVSYTIAGPPEPDGTGMTVIRLQKV